MCLVTTAEKAAELGLTPLVRLCPGWAGVEPKIMGIGRCPPPRSHWPSRPVVADMDLIELNEAFAAQALAVMREWEFTPADLEAHQCARIRHLLGAPGGGDRWARCSPAWPGRAPAT